MSTSAADPAAPADPAAADDPTSPPVDPSAPSADPVPEPGGPGDPGGGPSPPAAPPTLGVSHGSLLGVAHTVIVQVRGLGAGGVVTLDATTPAPVLGLAPGCGLVRLGTVSCAVRADAARLTLQVLPPPGRGTSVVVRVTRAADGAGRSASLVLTP